MHTFAQLAASKGASPLDNMVLMGVGIVIVVGIILKFVFKLNGLLVILTVCLVSTGALYMSPHVDGIPLTRITLGILAVAALLLWMARAVSKRGRR